MAVGRRKLASLRSGGWRFSQSMTSNRKEDVAPPPKTFIDSITMIPQHKRANSRLQASAAAENDFASKFAKVVGDSISTSSMLYHAPTRALKAYT